MLSGAHVNARAQVALHEGGVALRVVLGQTHILAEHEAGDLVVLLKLLPDVLDLLL